MKSAVISLSHGDTVLGKALRRAIGVAKTAREAGWYWQDWRGYGAAMTWKGRRDYWTISSELIFQYHKLEKGMCLPPPHRFFGKDAANATLRLMREWRDAGLDLHHPVYRAALDTLQGYRARLDETPPPDSIGRDLIARIDAVLQDFDHRLAEATPITPRPVPDEAADTLRQIAEGRRSVRAFTGEPVDFALVEDAARTAQLAPSACNRQPCRIHFYDDRADIDGLLALQNGNSGFGHTIPLLAVVTADCGSFFGRLERIEPVLDAGLFLSPFLLALQAHGLSSCCLNWCVPPELDRKAHRIGRIPDAHQIVTFLAIGKAQPDVIVPRSHRRPIEDCLIRHTPLQPA